MSQAEGYELFMCPECEHNIYEPGPACPRCGYTIHPRQSPSRPRRQPTKTPTLLQTARRNNNQAERTTMLLIHSMPAPKDRPYTRWAHLIHTLLSRIAQHPFSLTPETQASLRQIHNLLKRNRTTPEALEQLLHHCNTLLESIEAQRPTPITAPKPARHNNHRHRPPNSKTNTTTPSRALPTEYALSLPERRVLQALEKALKSLANFKNTGQRYREPEGSLLAELPLTEDQDLLEVRARIDQQLAGTTWVTAWRTDRPHGAQRTFTINNTSYTLILDHTTNNAYYIELREPTNKWA